MRVYKKYKAKESFSARLEIFKPNLVPKYCFLSQEVERQGEKIWLGKEKWITNLKCNSESQFLLKFVNFNYNLSTLCSSSVFLCHFNV